MDVFGKQLLKKRNFGERLAQKRSRLKLSQEALAEAIGTSPRSVSRWEHNQSLPQQYYRELLCEVLECTPEDLFGENDEKPQVSAQSVPLWHVPYTRNLYFSGREAALHQIYEGLHTQHQVTLTQSQIVSGMGGIGKTQTVLEYAYQFRSDYQAILWVGAETYETLMSDYLALAHLFQLPEKESSDRNRLKEAVKRWLQQHTDWLLIFDNVENLELVHSMLPGASQGHILITTRSQITGTLGVHIDLQKMDLSEGTLFLLRRSKLLSPNLSLEEAPVPLIEQAKKIVEMLDGLPLALDQAGAYIEETACSLSDYLELYISRQNILLNSRGELSSHHPASVTTTLSLAFQQVERASPTAADLLRLCAFLHAEAIPEEFIIQAGETLGPLLQAISTDPLLLNTAIKELRRFSLIYREPEAKTLSIHRLLQEIIKEKMLEEERKLWMERIIYAMLHIFPANEARSNGVNLNLQRCLSHALACIDLIDKWNVTSLEAAELLYRVVCYLQYYGDYSQVVSFMLRAFTIAKSVLGIENSQVAFYLNALAVIYFEVGQYIQAEESFRQALAIRKRVQGPKHPDIIESLWGLASLFCLKGMYKDAEACALEALTIEEQASNPKIPNVVLVLNLLGVCYTRQRKYVQAEQSIQKARRISEEELGKEHLFVAPCLKNLGYLAFIQHDYTKAIDLYQQILQIHAKYLDPYHLSMAGNYNRIGYMYFLKQDYQQAEICYRKALTIYEQRSLFHSIDVTCTLVNLGELYIMQSQFHAAKIYLQKAVTFLEGARQLNHIDHEEITHCLTLIGDYFTLQGKVMEAEDYYQRAFITRVYRE